MRYGEGEPLDSKLLPPNSQVILLFFVILVILFQTPPPLFFYHQNPTFAVHLSTPLVFVFWIESNTFCLDSFDFVCQNKLEGALDLHFPKTL